MATKRLTRSNNDKVIAGICGGLGKYFDIDPVIFRIIFIVLFIGGGSGMLLYIIMWIVIPKNNKFNSQQNATIITPPPSEYQNNTNAADGYSTSETDDELPKKNSLGAYITGIFLILMGAYFLCRHWIHIRFSQLWPIFLIIIGISIIVSFYQKTAQHEKK